MRSEVVFLYFYVCGSEQTFVLAKPKTVNINYYRMPKMKNAKTNLTSSRLITPLSKIVILSLALLLISSCSDNDKPAATQIVAKVNDDEISVHQLNNSMAQMPLIAPENLASVRLDLVGKLVNEQLAVQQALSLKLDRSSEVMMQIEAARREILTKAYLKQVVSALPKPSAEDTKKFYDAHPELFAERRIYNLQQITIPTPHPPLADIQKLTADKTMTDIVTSLKQNKILFTAGAATRAAEQIPLTTLSALAKSQDGQINIIESPQSITIVRVEASQLAPLSEELALQRIPQYLMNDQAKAAVNDKLAQLKSTSKIVYMNEFSDAAKSVATLPAPANKPTQINDSVERGIAGIN
jgi:EpsD family peptidyl-prolyl cis-trans isomerase